MRTGSVNYAILGALIGVLILLGILLVEQNHVEHRLIVQSEQIHALGEATERLSNRGTGTALRNDTPAVPDEQPAHVLHPDVPNFLVPRDKHWPPPGANLDGVLSRDWAYGDPKGFNQLTENAGEIQELIQQYVGLSLADMNSWTDPDKWHGDIATRVEITDDYKEFTIYLRHGVKWETPSGVDLNSPKYAWLKGDHEVTTKDFVFTLDLIMNPQVEDGVLKNYYAELESYKAIDDYTLVIRWKKKQFVNIAWSIGVGPVPEFLYSKDEDGQAIPKESLGLRFNQYWYDHKGYIGAGPYRLATYEPGSRIVLERNDDFFGDKPAIQKIVYPIYTDPQQTLLKLKSHEIGLGMLQPSQYREEIKQYENAAQKPPNSPFFDGRIHCSKAPKFAYYYIGWNANKPLFADKRVRRAMTLALNRQDLIESVFAGLGEISTGPYLPDSPNNDPNVHALPFDLDQARALLAEAGWKDTDGDGVLDKTLNPGDPKRTPFEFTLLIYASRSEWAALANVYKEDLLKIGVRMNIDSAEWSLMQKKMEEKAFDAYTGGWGLPWDTDLYQIWHSSQADIPNGSNRVGFRNKEADAIIEKARVTFDQSERRDLFRAFHRLVHEEQPYTFIIARKDVWCVWNDVKNVEFAKVRPAANTLPWSVARSAD